MITLLSTNWVFFDHNLLMAQVLVSFAKKISLFMKKIILGGLIAFSLMTANQVKAQDRGGFGIKGGVGLTTISFPKDEFDDQKNRMKVGGLVGISYEHFFGDHFALDVEALAVNRGSKQTWDLPGGNTAVYKNNIIAIDVPVSAKWYIIDNLNIYVGPYFSTTVAAFGKSYTKTEDGDKINEEDSENLFSEDFEDLDGDRYLNRFDVVINAGLEFVTDGGFGVGARFNKGFLDFTNDDWFVGDGKNVTHTGIQIYGVVRF